MKKLHFLLCFAILIIVASCKKNDDNNQQPEMDFIIFGHYYGFCGGEQCVEVFKMENGKLYEDTLDLYPFSTPYNGVYIQLSDAQYQQVKDIVNYFPAELLSQPNTIFGQPDAYDQGGLYVEVKDNGQRKFWRIDTAKNSVPSYLHSFMDKINEKITLLQ